MKKRMIAMLLLLFFLVPTRVSAASDSAAASIVIDGVTGEIIYGHDTSRRLPMASTTKIMSALLLCEAGAPETVVRVTESMILVEGSSMGLKPGDFVTYRALLYGMMLSSGNDAANVTAVALAGSRQKFVDQMNRRAEDLGLFDTHFETPSGLDGQQHYTTARDLAKLMRFSLQNPTFAAATATVSETVYFGDPMVPHTLKNHHRLLAEYDGAVGGKTGFTKKAGRCLVTAAKRDGKYVICVTLHDSNDWADHRNLLDFGFQNATSYQPPNPKTVQNPTPLDFKSKESIFYRFCGMFYSIIQYL